VLEHPRLDAYKPKIACERVKENTTNPVAYSRSGRVLIYVDRLRIGKTNLDPERKIIRHITET